MEVSYSRAMALENVIVVHRMIEGTDTVDSGSIPIKNSSPLSTGAVGKVTVR